jgi:hypothetical protein
MASTVETLKKKKIASNEIGAIRRFLAIFYKPSINLNNFRAFIN